jgi:hypothetical protein
MMVMFVVVVRVCPTLVTSTECLDLNNWTVGVYSGNVVVVVAPRRYADFLSISLDRVNCLS